MQQLILLRRPVPRSMVDLIDRVEGTEHEASVQASVYFKNGLLLTLLGGEGAFTTEEAPFELGVHDENGLSGDLLKPEHRGSDDVLTNCTAEVVFEYLEYLGTQQR